jgi:hypothetical protein
LLSNQPGPNPWRRHGAHLFDGIDGIYFFVALVASIAVIGLCVRFALSVTGLCVRFAFRDWLFVAFELPLSATNAKAVTLTKSAIQSIKGMSFFIVNCLPFEVSQSAKCSRNLSIVNGGKRRPKLSLFPQLI